MSNLKERASRGAIILGVVLTISILLLASSASPSMAATSSGSSLQKLPPGSINATVNETMGKLKVATGSTTRGVNGKTITIEGIASVTQGGSPQFPGVCDGAAAAFAAANRQGGVNGYKINYIGCHDDGTVEATANQLTQQAVDQNHVFAIVPYASLVGTTTLLNTDHVPYFGVGFNFAAFCGWNGVQFGFSVLSAEACLGSANGSTIYSDVSLASYLEAKKISGSSVRVAFVTQQLPGNEASLKIETLLAEHLGMKVVYAKAPIPGPESPQLTSYAPIAQQIVSSGANFVVDLASGESVLGVAGALKEASYTGGYLQFTITDSAYLSVSAVAQALNQAYGQPPQVGSTAFPSKNLAVIARNLKAIGAKPQINLGTLSSYASATLFLAALKRVTGTLTTEKVAAVLNNGFSYPGIPTAVCPSIWPAAHVAASSCSSMVQINGSRLKPILRLGTWGSDYLIKNLG